MTCWGLPSSKGGKSGKWKILPAERRGCKKLWDLGLISKEPAFCCNHRSGFISKLKWSIELAHTFLITHNFGGEGCRNKD